MPRAEPACLTAEKQQRGRKYPLIPAEGWFLILNVLQMLEKELPLLSPLGLRVSNLTACPGNSHFRKNQLRGARQPRVAQTLPRDGALAAKPKSQSPSAPRRVENRWWQGENEPLPFRDVGGILCRSNGMKINAN